MAFKRKDIVIRMAVPADALALESLTAKSIGPFKVQWKGMTGDWLVAEVANVVLGCTQLCMGRPIGRVEMLCVAADLDLRSKHAIMLELCRGAMYALTQTGSQIITVFIMFESKGMKRMLKKRFGARVTNSGNLLTAYVGV